MRQVLRIEQDKPLVVNLKGIGHRGVVVVELFVDELGFVLIQLNHQRFRALGVIRSDVKHCVVSGYLNDLVAANVQRHSFLKQDGSIHV